MLVMYMYVCVCVRVCVCVCVFVCVCVCVHHGRSSILMHVRARTHTRLHTTRFHCSRLESGWRLGLGARNV